MSLDKLYNNIFTLEYLIKYGYFSYKPKKSDGNEYFSTDTIYKIFNMDDYVYKLPLVMSELTTESKDKKIDTEPIQFSIPKKDLSRRQYKFPNLYSYTDLANFICKNKQEFIDIFVRNKFSTSKFFDLPGYTFKNTQKIKDKLLQLGDKEIYIDFSNFYHTIYTHSIPWIIMGKSKAKANRSNKGFANKLDKLLESCQSGETHGIPVGNLLSQIIAELFMCYFDEEMKRENLVYHRYVDDITFAFTLEKERDKFLEEINLMCRKYNLYLNSEKIVMEKFPQNDVLDKQKLFTFFDIRKFGKSKIPKKRDLISEYINLCVSEESLGNKGALKIIFTGLHNNVKNDVMTVNDVFLYIDPLTDTSLFEKIFDISIKKPELTNRFMDFFENFFRDSKSIKKGKKIIQGYFDKNRNSILEKVKYLRKNKFNQEIYQLMLYIVQFDINIGNFLKEDKILEMLDGDLDDLCLILLTIAYLKSDYNVTKLLEKIEQILGDEHKKYSNPNKEVSRFTERFWYFRYFIYYLLEIGIISKQDLTNHLTTVKKDKNGIILSELNLIYVFKKGNKRAGHEKVDEFYKKLLEYKTILVDCGKNNDFKYF